MFTSGRRIYTRTLRINKTRLRSPVKSHLIYFVGVPHIDPRTDRAAEVMPATGTQSQETATIYSDLVCPRHISACPRTAKSQQHSIVGTGYVIIYDGLLLFTYFAIFLLLAVYVTLAYTDVYDRCRRPELFAAKIKIIHLFSYSFRFYSSIRNPKLNA